MGFSVSNVVIRLLLLQVTGWNNMMHNHFFGGVEAWIVLPTGRTTKVTPTSASLSFPGRRISGIYSSQLVVPLSSSTTTESASDEITTRRGTQQQREERTPESARLSKAKALLEQYVANSNSDDDGADLISAVSTSDVAAVGTAADASSSSSTANGSSSVVPDGLWLNGHLRTDDMEKIVGPSSNDLVTRWARGVKVAEPLVSYDPVAAEKLLKKQPRKWLVRNFQIALPLGWWAVGVVTDFITSGGGGGGINSDATSSSKSRTDRRRRRAKQLTQAISSLGPAIIKGGQALASRPDLLPKEYLDELQNLQDNVPRFGNDLAFATVEEELNQSFDSIFELVQPEPVAAASIGQVYQARLKANGDLVAIKIQRPDCEQVIALDLYVLRWWSGVYNRILQWLSRDIDLQSIIDDFGELIYREIDYVAEAANAQRFNELYATNVVAAKDVFVPKIYSELTTAKVLTMEWVDGVRLTDRAGLQRYNLNESELVDTLVQCSLQQILQNGFFHADPHGGNLLACPDGRLCYLDFGMMSYAASHQRNGFLLAVVHIVNRDWARLCQLYVKLGFIPKGTDLEEIQLALDRALPDVLDADITELNFKNVVTKLGDIMYTYPFSLPPFYIAIIRCLGVLEGLAIQVDPKARIIAEAYPYVASRVLTDPQDDLQEALRGLALTRDGQVRWDRLEGLLEEAQGSQGYDVALALDILTDYIISEQGETLLQELADQLVLAADNLGTETLQYLVAATSALAINDEVAAVKAFRSLQAVLGQGDWDKARDQAQSQVLSVLPEPTPSMARLSRILELLGSNKPSTGSPESSSLTGIEASSFDPARFVPIIRKLSQEPRVQKTANEVLARFGERLLSRGLRAVFGLPSPNFTPAPSPQNST